eukprot:CAMPEP_0171207910 /NCGR_PEP_ID=MMETSP0790-20130122/27818_1 /TAXON_ID=2925 /ORGANISM="Alexandrium catenella, Strain OF101" /LENGTH=111 /DNA_ID=CAMNT_0011673493 /DNA_START=80 /DNA_END=412 /DNA_ORIENTATION=-
MGKVDPDSKQVVPELVHVTQHGHRSCSILWFLKADKGRADIPTVLWHVDVHLFYAAIQAKDLLDFRLDYVNGKVPHVQLSLLFSHYGRPPRTPDPVARGRVAAHTPSRALE